MTLFLQEVAGIQKQTDTIPCQIALFARQPQITVNKYISIIEQYQKKEAVKVLSSEMDQAKA